MQFSIQLLVQKWYDEYVLYICMCVSLFCFSSLFSL